VCDYKRGLDWWIDLLTTYTHHSKLQVITALSLISALYKSLAHAKSSQSSLDVFWQRLLTVEILQLPALRPSCHSRSCRTFVFCQFNYRTISSQPPLQSSTQLPTLNWQDCPSCLLYNSSLQMSSKTAFFYCCVRVYFCRNVLTKPFLRNAHLNIRLLHSNDFTRCLGSLPSNGFIRHSINNRTYQNRMVYLQIFFFCQWLLAFRMTIEYVRLFPTPQKILACFHIRTKLNVSIYLQ
jgi:hypothetical protein